MVMTNLALLHCVGEETPGEWVVYLPVRTELLENRIGSVSRSLKPLHLPPPGQWSVRPVDSVSYSLLLLDIDAYLG